MKIIPFQGPAVQFAAHGHDKHVDRFGRVIIQQMGAEDLPGFFVHQRMGRFEKEQNWVEIDVLENDRISGRFQATYVVQQNQYDFHSLHETLRFNNVVFEAKYVDVGD